MNKFLLEIVTPSKQVFSQEVNSLSVPTLKGNIGVLPHHMPLFSALYEGELKITLDEKELFLAIGGGFMEVHRDRVLVLVSRAVHADEINETEIKKAQDEARVAIKRQIKGEELAQAQAVLRRSILELKILRKKRVGISGNRASL